MSSNNETQVPGEVKKQWESPVLSEINVSETANGMIGNDGQGGGSQGGGNMSGS